MRLFKDSHVNLSNRIPPHVALLQRLYLARQLPHGHIPFPMAWDRNMNFCVSWVVINQSQHTFFLIGKLWILF